LTYTVEQISDRVADMYLGKIVEMAPRDVLFENLIHPYTRALISAIPIPDPQLERARVLLECEVPSPSNPPAVCRFHPRCPVAMDICSQEEPQFEEMGPDHWVACFKVKESNLVEV
jgi:oligopeptide/dipeptide ABC transporter ATP-binding protein